MDFRVVIEEPIVKSGFNVNSPWKYLPRFFEFLTANGISPKNGRGIGPGGYL